jgi:hypothetical protein
MSLRDKRRDKRRRKREFRRQNPNHAAELALQRQREELPQRLEHLQALQDLGGRLLIDPALRQTLVAAAGSDFVQEAIVVHENPAGVEQLRQRVAEIDQQAGTSAQAKPSVTVAISGAKPEDSPRRTVLEKRYRLVVDLMVAVKELGALAGASEAERFFHEKQRKLHEAILASPAALNRLALSEIAYVFETLDIFDLLEAPSTFEAIEPALDLLDNQDAEWIREAFDDGVSYESLGGALDCLQVRREGATLAEVAPEVF